jgi:hypothetical protein
LIGHGKSSGERDFREKVEGIRVKEKLVESSSHQSFLCKKHQIYRAPLDYKRKFL